MNNTARNIAANTLWLSSEYQRDNIDITDDGITIYYCSPFLNSYRNFSISWETMSLEEREFQNLTEEWKEKNNALCKSESKLSSAKQLLASAQFGLKQAEESYTRERGEYEKQIGMLGFQTQNSSKE